MAGSYQLPNPNSPATNDALNSLAIRQNFQSIQSQINNADGAALNAKTVQEASLADAINPRLFRTQSGTGTFVVSGFSMSVPGSSLSVSLPSGTAYVNGFLTIYAGSTVTVVVSQDTYLDLTSGGAIVQQGVANNATPPTLAAGNLRLAKIVSNGSVITAITQTGLDALGNVIYQRKSPASQLINFSGTVQTSNGVFTNPGWNNTSYATAGSGGTWTVTSAGPETIEVIVPYTYFTNTNGTGFNVQVTIDGVQVCAFGGPAVNPGVPFSMTLIGSGTVAAGTHTILVQAATQGAGTFTLYHGVKITRYYGG